MVPLPLVAWFRLVTTLLPKVPPVPRVMSRSSKPEAVLLVLICTAPVYWLLPVPVAAVVWRVFHFFRMAPVWAFTR